MHHSMSIQIIKDLPELVGTRNDAWIKVHLTETATLQVKVIYSSNVITTMRMSPDSGNNVSFNLKRIIQSIGSLPNLIDADLPAYNQGFVSPCTNIVKQFSVEITELNPADDTILDTHTTVAIALLAGLTLELAFSTSLLDYLAGPSQRFLTNMPQVQSVGTATQVFLYFYNTNLDYLDAQVSVRFRIYYTDGTDSGVLTLSTQLLFCSIIPAGYNQLDIPMYVPVGKTVDHYEVYIDDQGTLTEIRRFDLDQACYPDGREFLFLNSLGGMDPLRIRMVEEINLDRQSDVVERYQSADTSLMDGQYFETGILTTRKFKVNTNQWLAEDRLWLQEFFASPKIFEVNNGRFLPIRILSSSVLIKNKADYLAVSFEYRYRFDDIGYTKQ